MFSMLSSIPYAGAEISGKPMYPDISGSVMFYEVYGGTLVVVSVRNLPDENEFHGFHVHDERSCESMMGGGHYNPMGNPHPQHAGDMPSLLANDGMAFSAFYTNRFYPEDVIGKTVMIHANVDDFISQPSGDAGDIIACGEIKRWEDMESE